MISTADGSLFLFFWQDFFGKAHDAQVKIVTFSCHDSSHGGGGWGGEGVVHHRSHSQSVALACTCGFRAGVAWFFGRALARLSRMKSCCTTDGCSIVGAVGKYVPGGGSCSTIF